MSSDAMAIRNVQVGGRPWVEVLHEWVTTVDHKRLGILYILYSLIFLVVAGVEAVIIRVQLMYPHNNFVSPQVFNRMFTMHGTTMIFFVAIPVLFGFANYLVPLMVGARDTAFPRLNAFSFWLTAMGVLLFPWRKRIVWRRQRSGRWMVGIRSFALACVFTRQQLRLLDDCGSGCRIWDDRCGHQSHRHHTLPALPRDAPQPHAPAGVAQPGDVRRGSLRSDAAVRRADHAACGSVPGRPLLR